MELKRNEKLLTYSRELRKNMTKEEKKLWYQFLSPLRKTGGIIFHRQEIIGNYIVDFYCPKQKLVIELDGSQHYTEDGKRADISRDDALALEGITVLRFTNIEINQKFENCCAEILKTLGGSI